MHLKDAIWKINRFFSTFQVSSNSVSFLKKCSEITVNLTDSFVDYCTDTSASWKVSLVDLSLKTDKQAEESGRVA